MNTLDTLSARIHEIAKQIEPAGLSPDEKFKLRRERLMYVREAIDDAMIQLITDCVEPTGLEITYRQRVDFRSRSMEDMCELLNDADAWSDAWQES